MTTPSSPAPIDAAATQAFIARWQGVAASELSTAQSFVIDLCALLGVERPHPTPRPTKATCSSAPSPSRTATAAPAPGASTATGVATWCWRQKSSRLAAIPKALTMACCARAAKLKTTPVPCPPTRARPPFVLVVDVGTVIEVYAEFSKSGGTYTPFPDPRSHRLALADLARPEVQERLRRIWQDPDSLNPARISAQVTRDVAALLAQLAKSLEGGNASASSNPGAGTNFKPNKPEDQAQQALPASENIASYLTRCLFSMFAEDVELLPKGAFLGLLQTHRNDPATLQQMLRILWTDMDKGGFSAALAKPVLHFNGKLFKGAERDGYSLLLTPAQIDLLIQAAKANWREVEPAIFGTLLERALSPTERHALGAHYTPRAYVERLVLPTVIAPLRADWANAQAAALEGKAAEAKLAEARAEVKKFHHQLCTTRVLDPACGSANFLYVTLEHLKRLEGEVVNQLEALGHTQDQLGFEGETVTLQQLRGIELNERAAALAELVLWIGYLQWHIRTRGNAAVAEPVVHNYGNIECRDAVLAWDAQELAYDEAGQLLSRWDGVTFKVHPVTGEKVPDEAAQVPQWRYVGARPAPWPQADFIVGNPPFIGKLRMREALGDGYVQALRAAWPEVPDSADFVMFWWARAAALVSARSCKRMGLITTNSLTMVFNRRVVQAGLDGALTCTGLEGAALDGAALAGVGLVDAGATGGDGAGEAGDAAPIPGQPCHLVFAIADHPWVDGANGAAVRIAMTVLAPDAGEGQLCSVVGEQTGEHGEVAVELIERTGLIHADLKVGANVTQAQTLQANAKLSSAGVIPHGAAMQLTAEEAATMEADAPIKPYRNGKDLTDKSRGLLVIDCHGLSAEQVRERYPRLYQWLLDRVKPERDVNKDKDLREKWWLHRRNNDDMRRASAGLPRYIATVMTAKHRIFQFLDGAILPDQMLVVIALNDAYALGVLSSQLHAEWALATGSTLEDRPRYNKSRCFETFPFPDDDTGLTPELRQRIVLLAEQIDAHRKRVLGQVGAAAGDFASAARMSPPQCPPAPALPATAPAPALPATTPAAAQAQTATALTLTGLYNVLAALREGRPLNAKEKAIHSAGLVGVLRELHDELDAAVLAAYGWADLAADMASAPATETHTSAVAQLLLRLVQLNTQRAAEEAQGRVRWLRPAFQNPQKSLSKTELLALDTQAPGANLDDEKLLSKTEQSKPTQQTPWPAQLPEQVRAVAAVLAASPVPLSLSAIEAHFKGRGPWKKSLPTLLQTLEALGRAQCVQHQGASAWRG
ncbi:class I SAM-dependent DNA methyltransferase [Simplicispira metamorpha]|nr:DNA methyltransferase [Simplicispira metamorpha]